MSEGRPGRIHNTQGTHNWHVCCIDLSPHAQRGRGNDDCIHTVGSHARTGAISTSPFKRGRLQAVAGAVRGTKAAPAGSLQTRTKGIAVTVLETNSNHGVVSMYACINIQYRHICIQTRYTCVHTGALRSRGWARKLGNKSSDLAACTRPSERRGLADPRRS